MNILKMDSAHSKRVLVILAGDSVQNARICIFKNMITEELGNFFVTFPPTTILV